MKEKKNAIGLKKDMTVVCTECGHKSKLTFFFGVAPKQEWDKFLKKTKEPK